LTNHWLIIQATWRTPYLYVFSMAYYTLTRILYYLNEVNTH